jgi:16S rRNA (uracil1498-N3)-methyltransferase
LSQIPRFFLDGPIEEVVRIEGPVAHQISRVLRLRSGDRIVVLDGRGSAWEAALSEVRNGTVMARRDKPAPCASEPARAVTLFAAVLKGDRQDWLIQKAVELGVAGIQPILTAHGVARPGGDKTERWRRIAREAAEQCERGIVPPVAEPIPVSSATWPGMAIVCTERDGMPLKAALAGRSGDLAIFIGPEGGWEVAEVAALGDQGAIAASLGPRILRAETAALAALAMIVGDGP